MAMETVALRRPSPDGSKAMVKDVDPPGPMPDPGWFVTVKSLEPVRETAPSVSAPMPVFATVKERLTRPVVWSAEPKSVSSAPEGVASPDVISTPFPCTSISGAITTPVPWMANV